MNHPMSGLPGCCGITRRGFFLGLGAGLALGLPLTRLRRRGTRPEEPLPSFTGRSVENPRAEPGMPGPFPGRVIEVHHPGSVTPNNEINPEAVRVMLDRGMCQLVGADVPTDAWRRFFQPGDVVGIKVNPVGRRTNTDNSRLPGAVGSISSPELLLEIVSRLKEIGIKPRDIIVFERYAQEFREAGYEAVMRTRPMDGVRWLAAAHVYDNSQVEISGQPRDDRDPHVVGYDPDVFANMGFASPNHHPRDDRRFRSHVSNVVSRLVDKFITIPCLKDHRSAGVTLALKNMSHGMNNNVARSHLSGIYRYGGVVTGPNQCNTFIPTAVNQRPIVQKATLHIMDGLIGVYEGGPGAWNRTWATWQRKSLFFATDPVAMDHVGWDILDTKRAAEGWIPVGHMGLLDGTTGQGLSPRLAALAAMGSPEAGLLSLDKHHRRPDGRRSEVFDRRQPEHVILAGTLGLGKFNAAEIDYRTVRVTG